MNTAQQKIYSREYLQGLPAANRKRYLKTVVEQLFYHILEAAGKGDTTVLIPLSDDNLIKMCCHSMFQNSPPTYDEIIEIMREHFPDSKIQMEERWVEIKANTQVRKKGIFVDWS